MLSTYIFRSLDLQVLGEDNKNNVLVIKNLLHPIIPSESNFKVSKSAFEDAYKCI